MPLGPDFIENRVQVTAILDSLGALSDNGLLPGDEGVAAYVNEDGIDLHGLAGVVGEETAKRLETSLLGIEPIDEQGWTISSDDSVKQKRPWSSKNERSLQKLVGEKKRRIKGRYRQVGNRGPGRYSNNK